MGAVRLEKARAKLAGRIALAIAWRPFEIHPEVPPAGLPLASLGYEPADLAAAMASLQRHAAAEGIAFAPRTPASLLANTHRALAASAVVQAASPERFEVFHHALFRANFVDDRDVGDPAVLRELAAGAGLDANLVQAALAPGAGEAALREAAADAGRRCITAVPAFVFGGRTVIVGAQPADALATAAERTAAEG